jgi:hypothetical protein
MMDDQNKSLRIVGKNCSGYKKQSMSFLELWKVENRVALSR